MLRIQKTLYPDSAIPELEVSERVSANVKSVEEKLDAVMKRLEDRDNKSEENRRTAELQDRVAKGQNYLTGLGYNADGIKKIEELMLAENIASYAAGAALFEKLNPSPQPSDTTRGTPFSGVTDTAMHADDMKELWDSQGRSDAWLQKSLAGVRRDFRGN